jgi:hypothetical protein
VPPPVESLSVQRGAVTYFRTGWSLSGGYERRIVGAGKGGRPLNFQPAEMRTLQFGPLWVLSSLAGTYNRFKSYELAAFWDTIVAVALRTPHPARDILTSMTEDRSGLLLDFELDDRPVVSGLRHIVAILDRIEPEASADFRLALLRIGVAIARNRGPYGRTITREHEQLLLLIAELLDMDSLDDIGDDVLV